MATIKPKKKSTKPYIETHRELKRKALLFDKETGVHEYTFEEYKLDFAIEYRISYSNGSVWSEPFRGEVQWTILDHGNGIVLDNIRDMNLDYGKAHTLRLLFNMINLFEPEREMKYDVVEVSKESLTI